MGTSRIGYKRVVFEEIAQQILGCNKIAGFHPARITPFQVLRYGEGFFLGREPKILSSISLPMFPVSMPSFSNSPAAQAA